MSFVNKPSTLGDPARRAYSLIELLIVVMIVGILAAAGAPRLTQSITRFRIEAVVQRITGDLRYARRTAQQTSSLVTVEFQLSDNKYTVSGATSVNRRGQSLEFTLGETEYDCVLVSATFGSGNTLTFNVHGRPNFSGSIVVRCGDQTRSINVNDLGQAASS